MPGSAIPGEAWAERARREVLLEAHAPTVQHLMVRMHLIKYAGPQPGLIILNTRQ